MTYSPGLKAANLSYQRDLDLEEERGKDLSERGKRGKGRKEAPLSTMWNHHTYTKPCMRSEERREESSTTSRQGKRGEGAFLSASRKKSRTTVLVRLSNFSIEGERRKKKTSRSQKGIIPPTAS